MRVALSFAASGKWFDYGMDSFEREEVSDTFNSTSSKRFDKYPVEEPKTKLDASRQPFVTSGKKLSMIIFSRFLLFRLLEQRRFLFFFFFQKKRLVGAAWRAWERRAPTTKVPAIAAIMLMVDGVKMARVLLWNEILWRRFNNTIEYCRILTITYNHQMHDAICGKRTVMRSRITLVLLFFASTVG